MHILIFDRDEAVAALLKSKLAAPGRDITLRAGTADSIAPLDPRSVEVIFVDPSPHKNAEQAIITLRRQIPTQAYVVLMGTDVTPEQGLAAGANDILKKPFNPGDIALRMENAERLRELQRRLNDPDDDFPSGGGVIAKSAFCQLFLSAVDRADRYGERSYVIRMALRNYNQIKVMDSDHAADVAAATVAQHIVRMRRGSDILGQIGPYEYALLLQRPVGSDEPTEATLRFADRLARSLELARRTPVPIEILLTLVEIPTGASALMHEVCIGTQDEISRRGGLG